MQENVPSKNIKETRLTTSAVTCSCRPLPVRGGAVLKDIPGFPDYKADALGNIWSFKRATPKILKVFARSSAPYLSVALFHNRSHFYQVHRLILCAFAGEAPTPKHVGRHLNGIPTDNRIDNLAWGTISENWEDSRMHGTSRRKNRKSAHQLTISEILQIKDLLKRGYSQNAISQKFGVARMTISRIRSGARWKHVQITHNLAGAL